MLTFLALSPILTGAFDITGLKETFDNLHTIQHDKLQAAFNKLSEEKEEAAKDLKEVLLKLPNITDWTVSTQVNKHFTAVVKGLSKELAGLQDKASKKAKRTLERAKTCPSNVLNTLGTQVEDFREYCVSTDDGKKESTNETIHIFCLLLQSDLMGDLNHRKIFIKEMAPGSVPDKHKDAFYEWVREHEKVIARVRSDLHAWEDGGDEGDFDLTKDLIHLYKTLFADRESRERKIVDEAVKDYEKAMEQKEEIWNRAANWLLSLTDNDVDQVHQATEEFFEHMKKVCKYVKFGEQESTESFTENENVKWGCAIAQQGVAASAKASARESGEAEKTRVGAVMLLVATLAL